MNARVNAVPWDSVSLGYPCWEIVDYSPEMLASAILNDGHYTVKVDPLVDKRALHECGFYYCDTLVEPVADANAIKRFCHASATVDSLCLQQDMALSLCEDAFSHGRFHRDFNVSREFAKCRYTNWLRQLIASQQVLGLRWDGLFAGFIAVQGAGLVLHATAPEYRGRGLAKYWWSETCKILTERGCQEISSSVSASNLPVMNLYASLGFSFKRVYDVYHKVVKN